MPSWRPANSCPFICRSRKRIKKRIKEKSGKIIRKIRFKPEKLSSLNKIIRKYQAGSCLFCDSNSQDENLCGDLRFYEPLNLTVHYFCLLFSPNLIQNQQDSFGLAGFQITKIVDEIICAQKNICFYCCKPGANARCLHEENGLKREKTAAQFCKNLFHVSGKKCFNKQVKNLNFSTKSGKNSIFRTYCHEHHVIPRGPWELQRSGRMRFYGYGMVRCGICSLYVKSRADLDVFRSFCCKFAYFHGECTQKLALSAGGYALRCPLCNNSQDFQNYLLDRGVYIPIRDSMWEIDGENRYASLYERPKICSYENCTSKNFTPEDEILYCCLCGSQAVHKRCLVQNSTISCSKNSKKKKKRRLMPEWKCSSCD
uniref:PHD-type domain-containing protein n=1 Tax=Romanomermis culicivorax TaxID=13658 RepID=A0A915J7X0_ROMCU